MKNSKNCLCGWVCLGLLGPTLRGQEGDVIVVTFRNMVDQPCNIHTHGVAYGKQSEGVFLRVFTVGYSNASLRAGGKCLVSELLLMPRDRERRHHRR